MTLPAGDDTSCGAAHAPLRVAMLGPIAWRTPPTHYGPWERVTSLLTEGLVARGVDVTLFATADSQTTARLDSVSPHGYAEDPTMDGRVWEALHVAHALSRSAEFDLVHNQLDWLPLAFSAQCAAPMVTTVHGFSGPTILPAYQRARSTFVAISDADRSPDLDYLATITHGVDFAELPLRAAAGDAAGEYLVAFGRIHPDKGTAEAIEIARRAGRRLIICGIVQDARYFTERVEPHIDGDRVVYLGSVGPAARAEVLGAAAVLLHPIAFAEPFGLSVVEAMACGTPVVAYRRGSMSEVVDEGVTGFLIDIDGARQPSVDAAVDAIGPAIRLNRAAVRAQAERRFGVDRMVTDYLRVYERLLSDEVG
jgi:glycosyltransferase involved in cell wall biosynthesis